MNPPPKSHSPLLAMNGVHARTGRYLNPAITRDELARHVLATPTQDDGTVRRWEDAAERAKSQHLGLPGSVDPLRIESAGWGLVCHASEATELEELLEPLLTHRRARAGSKFKLLVHNGERYSQWIALQGVAPSTPDVDTVPYYLLLAGSPEHLSFEFEQAISLDYAVGRIHFDDPQGYRRYADSVCAHESSPTHQRDPLVTLFGTRHDAATELSADLLLRPLVEMLLRPSGSLEVPELGVSAHVGAAATKSELSSVLSGAIQRPCLVVTATHGLGTDLGDPDQEGLQGALLCQDWSVGHPITPDQYLAAADVDPEWDVAGLIAFHFACYSGGTPSHDQFGGLTEAPIEQLASQSFTAALPQALLSHPRGGAVACISHIDRCWSVAFPDGGPQAAPGTFARLIERLVLHEPVGHAVRDLRDRFAPFAAEVEHLRRASRLGANVDCDELLFAWLSRNDALTYTVLGDPAVRVRPHG